MFVLNQPALVMEVAKYDRYLNISGRLAMSFKSSHEMSLDT